MGGADTGGPRPPPPAFPVTTLTPERGIRGASAGHPPDRGHAGPDAEAQQVVLDLFHEQGPQRRIPPAPPLRRPRAAEAHACTGPPAVLIRPSRGNDPVLPRGRPLRKATPRSGTGGPAAFAPQPRRGRQRRLGERPLGIAHVRRVSRPAGTAAETARTAPAPYRRSTLRRRGPGGSVDRHKSRSSGPRSRTSLSAFLLRWARI
jgi:hypothetical protein